MKNIGIIVNIGKDSKLEITSSIIKWLENRNCRPYLEPNIADLLSREDLKSHDDSIYKETEFIITLGGDGTLLGAAKDIKENQTPILGINMGRLGFLTEVETQDIFTVLDRVISGEFTIENRMMLESNIITGNSTIGPFYSLNDTYITGGIQSRPVTMDVSIGEDYLNTYVADGIVVSTPTGSTAYTLSAGGPIISPGLKAILITPLCAHSLSARSIVVSDNDIVNITVDDRYHNAYFNADSHSGYALKGGDRVTVKKAPFYTKLIKTSGISFFELLRLKLKER
jgi:NAD+ kinase